MRVVALFVVAPIGATTNRATTLITVGEATMRLRYHRITAV